MKTITATSGRGWAYSGAVLGGLVSIAANVAHSFIPPAGAPAGWTPEKGAVASAIVWPVFLFFAVEILARVPWPHGRWWGVLRFGGMVPVVLVAAFVSYRHLSGLLAHYGEETVVCFLGPLAVDGLMVMATSALLATSAKRRAAATSATTDVPMPTAAPAPSSDAAAPARKTTPRKAAPAKTTKPPAKTAPRKSSPAKTAPVPALTTAAPATPDRSVLSSATRESASSTATPAHRVSTAPAAAPTTSPTLSSPGSDVARPPALPVPAALLTRARHLAETHRAQEGTPITAGELAARMRVNSDTARQLLAVLDLAPDSPTRPADAVNGSATAAAAR
jgi:hypothetical protein